MLRGVGVRNHDRRTLEQLVALDLLQLVLKGALEGVVLRGAVELLQDLLCRGQEGGYQVLEHWGAGIQTLSRNLLCLLVVEELRGIFLVRGRDLPKLVLEQGFELIVVKGWLVGAVEQEHPLAFDEALEEGYDSGLLLPVPSDGVCHFLDGRASLDLGDAQLDAVPALVAAALEEPLQKLDVFLEVRALDGGERHCQDQFDLRQLLDRGEEVVVAQQPRALFPVEQVGQVDQVGVSWSLEELDVGQDGDFLGLVEDCEVLELGLGFVLWVGLCLESFEGEFGKGVGEGGLACIFGADQEDCSASIGNPGKEIVHPFEQGGEGEVMLGCAPHEYTN